MALEFVYIDTATPELKSVAGVTLRAAIHLETIINAVSGEFDFNNISQLYDDLFLVGNVRSDATGDSDNVYCFFNDDLTASNYYRQALRGVNGSITNTEGSTPQVVSAPAASSLASCQGIFELTVPFYRSTDKIKLAKGYGAYSRNATEIDQGHIGMAWKGDDGSNAITRIRIRADGHAGDGLTGEIKLYGIKDIEIGSDPT